jgi:hypothetical protein
VRLDGLGTTLSYGRQPRCGFSRRSLALTFSLVRREYGTAEISFGEVGKLRGPEPGVEQG